MTSTTPQNPSATTITTPSTSTTQRPPREPFLHNVAVLAVILPPIIMILPPRKLDVYTLCLFGTTFIGANQLITEYTGISLLTRYQNKALELTAKAGGGLPPAGMEMQKRLKEERERLGKNGTERERLLKKEKEVGKWDTGKLQEEIDGEGGDGKQKGVFEKIWLGGEGEDWSERRKREEREKLEEGKGYLALIVGQVWDVWSQGDAKKEERRVKEGKDKILKEVKKMEDENKRS